MIAYGPEMPEPWRPMERIRRLRNPIREYAWGSRTALAELLGEPVPAPRPQAELWMGAHPVAPSEVQHDSGWMPLGDWIRNDPTEVLGAAVVGEFGDELPFLLKLITAEQPLSLQAHPDAAQARSGFERENRAGIPIAAPQRSYRDPNPKPELVCALTPFAALCGFRPLDDIVAQVDALRAHGLTAVMELLFDHGGRAFAGEVLHRAMVEIGKDLLFPSVPHAGPHRREVGRGQDEQHPQHLGRANLRGDTDDQLPVARVAAKRHVVH